jgi:hypothetical protein
MTLDQRRAIFFFTHKWIKAACNSGLKWFSTAYHAQQHDHNRDNKQDMNKAAQGVRSYEPQQPQNGQHNSDGVKHGSPHFW